jgi:hypothetical protein
MKTRTWVLAPVSPPSHPYPFRADQCYSGEARELTPSRRDLLSELVSRNNKLLSILPITDPGIGRMFQIVDYIMVSDWSDYSVSPEQFHDLPCATWRVDRCLWSLMPSIQLCSWVFCFPFCIRSRVSYNFSISIAITKQGASQMFHTTN